jgi:hypothetical protein
LGPHFCTHYFVAVLNRTVGDYPDFIEYQRWEAFSALYCQKTREHLRGLFQPALELITHPQQCTTRAGVAALDLLSVMVNLDRELVPHMARGGLPSIVLRLAFANPDHTILQQTVREFFEGVFRVKALRTPILTEFLDAVNQNIHGPSRSARANANELFKVVEKTGHADQNLLSLLKKSDVFIGLAKSRIAEYREAIEAPYGGPARYPVEEDVQALADRALSKLGF